MFKTKWKNNSEYDTWWHRMQSWLSSNIWRYRKDPKLFGKFNIIKSFSNLSEIDFSYSWKKNKTVLISSNKTKISEKEEDRESESEYEVDEDEEQYEESDDDLEGENDGEEDDLFEEDSQCQKYLELPSSSKAQSSIAL